MSLPASSLVPLLVCISAVLLPAQDDVAALARCLQDAAATRDEKVRAMHSLMRLQARAEPSTPALLALMQGDDELLGVTAMVTLGTVGPFFEKDVRDRIVAEVLAVRRRPKYRLHSSFPAHALSRLAVPADTPTEHLVELLRGRNPYAIEHAAHLLARRGADAREVLPALRDLARMPRLPALGSARFHDPFSGEVVTIQDATDRTVIAKKVVHHLLLRLAPEAPEALPVHIGRLDAEDTKVQLEALMALGRMGAAAAPAVPRLAALAASGASRPAQEAVTTLGLIGPAARRALPILRELARRPDAQIAARAKAALRQIER